MNFRSRWRRHRFELKKQFGVGLFFLLCLLPVVAAVHSGEIFTDVTDAAGITWKQFSGQSPDRFMTEAAGGGVAFIDYDGDGLLDIFLVHPSQECPLSQFGQRKIRRCRREGWR